MDGEEAEKMFDFEVFDSGSDGAYVSTPVTQEAAELSMDDTQSLPIQSTSTTDQGNSSIAVEQTGASGMYT